MEEKKFISCTSTDVECGASLLATLTWKWEHSTRQGLVPLYLPLSPGGASLTGRWGSGEVVHDGRLGGQRSSDCV